MAPCPERNPDFNQMKVNQRYHRSADCHALPLEMKLNNTDTTVKEVYALHRNIVEWYSYVCVYI